MIKKPSLPPAEEPRDKPLSLRVKGSTDKALRRAAEIEGRTVSALIDVIVEAWLRGNGYLR
jgi:uncharacterized protein (DUF1778 family)